MFVSLEETTQVGQSGDFVKGKLTIYTRKTERLATRNVECNDTIMLGRYP